MKDPYIREKITRDIVAARQQFNIELVMKRLREPKP
jgi:hypothetical protein